MFWNRGLRPQGEGYSDGLNSIPLSVVGTASAGSGICGRRDLLGEGACNCSTDALRNRKPDRPFEALQEARRLQERAQALACPALQTHGERLKSIPHLMGPVSIKRCHSLP